MKAVVRPTATFAPGSRMDGPGRPTLAVTLQVTLDGAADPAATVQQVVERIAAMGEVVALSPVGLVDSGAEAAAAVDPGTISLDIYSRSVTHGTEEITLCRREFDLLTYLAAHPNQVFTRRQLLDALWQNSFTGPRTVDVHVRRVRQKLASHQPVIATVRGVGYRLASGASLIMGHTPSRTPAATSPYQAVHRYGCTPPALVARGAA